MTVVLFLGHDRPAWKVHVSNRTHQSTWCFNCKRYFLNSLEIVENVTNIAKLERYICSVCRVSNGLNDIKKYSK